MRKIIAAAALAAATLGGLAAPAASAFASTGAGTNGQTVASASTNAGHKVHVINLQKARESAMARGVHLHRIAITAPRGKGHSTRASNPTFDCIEPNCDLQYGGGPVENTPKVYLLLWGPGWQTDSAQANVGSFMTQFYLGLGGGPSSSWMATTSQYGDYLGDHPFVGANPLVGTWNDTSVPPIGATHAQLAAEADAFGLARGIPVGSSNQQTRDSQIVVATQSGTIPDGFGTQYCAWHSTNSYSVPFTNLPYMLDAPQACGENFLGGVRGQLDGITMVAGHEFTETATDPYPTVGWGDTFDPSGGEIGDKCNWSRSSGYVQEETGSFAMQPLWSNAAHACVMKYVAWAQNPVTVLIVNPRYTQADVSWNSATNARDYRVVVKRVSTGATIQNTIVTGTSITIHNLVQKVKYTVSVKARPALPDAVISKVTFTTK